MSLVVDSNNIASTHVYLNSKILKKELTQRQRQRQKINIFKFQILILIYKKRKIIKKKLCKTFITRLIGSVFPLKQNKKHNKKSAIVSYI